MTFKFMRAGERIRAERAATRSDDGRDARCLCGALVARLVPGGVEIKCRRCQRIVVIELASGEPRHPG